MRYLARSGLEKGEPSRVFYSADGRELTELEAKREIRECCQANGYTYTFVASSKWAEFEPDDIRQAHVDMTYVDGELVHERAKLTGTTLRVSRRN